MAKQAKKLNGDKPATQADLAALAGVLTTRIDGLETTLMRRMDKLDDRMDKLESRMEKLESRMDRLETRMDSLERGQAAILKTVQSIDKQLATIKHLPERVERLESAAFPT
ncbi:MAG: hypothetical protein IH991_22195 [Planctomycetes bacterium]|nr:hypothetical protein [Planctomycetota bacterium]